MDEILRAVLKNEVEKVKSLIKESKSCVDRTWPDGLSSLHVTAQNDQGEMCELLIKEGANVAMTDSYGCTPLHYACRDNCVGITSILLRYKADVHCVVPGGYTPLHIAALYGFVDVVSTLLGYISNEDMDIPNDSRETPLHVASLYGFVEIVQVICQKGASVNARTSDGSTSLSLACRGGSLHCVKELMFYNSGIELANVRGMTPLHEAYQGNNIDIIACLLQHGADVNVINSCSEMPFELATPSTTKGIVQEWQQLTMNNSESTTDSIVNIEDYIVIVRCSECSIIRMYCFL